MVGRFWSAAESTVERSWDRAVKGYQSLQLVYDVQSQLEEWTKQGGSGNGAGNGVGSGARPAQNPKGAEKK